MIVALISAVASIIVWTVSILFWVCVVGFIVLYPMYLDGKRLEREYFEGRRLELEKRRLSYEASPEGRRASESFIDVDSVF